MDIREYNRQAWNAQVEKKNCWTIPVTAEQTRAAREGDWQVVLTPAIPVPRTWFPDLRGCRILALASGGGQQGPLFAAAGADVIVFDNSEKQLAQDRMVATRDHLVLSTVQGDMADLTAFEPGSFDLVFHPCSNCFVPDVRPVWRECYRVLRPGGILMAGFCNPAQFIFDALQMEKGKLEVRHELPYSELTDLHDAERDVFINRQEPLVFGHTLNDQLGGQLEAGFVMTDLFEDRMTDNPLSQYMATCIATRAVKPGPSH